MGSFGNSISIEIIFYTLLQYIEQHILVIWYVLLICPCLQSYIMFWVTSWILSCHMHCDVIRFNFEFWLALQMIYFNWFLKFLACFFFYSLHLFHVNYHQPLCVRIFTYLLSFTKISDKSKVVNGEKCLFLGAYGAAVLYRKKDDDSLVILKEISLHDLTATERQMAMNEVIISLIFCIQWHSQCRHSSIQFGCLVPCDFSIHYKITL